MHESLQMSPHTASRITPALPPGPSLADVLAALDSFDDISKQACLNMASSIRTFCRVLDRDPRFVAANGPALRNMMIAATPGAVGIKPRRWKNVLSDLRRAVRLTGHVSDGRVLDSDLSESWLTRLELIDSPYGRSTIRRFAQFCSRIQKGPQDVDLDLIERYRAYLDETQLHRDPDHSIGVLVRAWNSCVTTYSDWPSDVITLPDRREKYCVDWADMPASLAEDAAAFREHSLNPDPFDPGARKPVSQRTAETRDGYLRRLAAVVMETGTPTSDLRSLGDLVRPDRVRIALKVFLERAGNKSTTQIQGIAHLAALIAEHWAKLPAEDIAELRRICKRLHNPQVGLTEKNRRRLQQFADDRVVGALLDLPGKLSREAKAVPASRKAAYKMQMAVAIALLIFAPIRIGNLCALDRQRHFVPGRAGGKRTLFMVLPATMVKNDVDLEFPLPGEVIELLDLYMTRYQPLLYPDQPSSFLFPGSQGRPKGRNIMGKQINKTVKDRIGVDLNPHLIRHLAAYLHLEAFPGEYETVRRLLGHRSLKTTVNNYAGLETTAAVLHYDAAILARREAARSKQRGAT